MDYPQSRNNPSQSYASLPSLAMLLIGLMIGSVLPKHSMNFSTNSNPTSAQEWIEQQNAANAKTDLSPMIQCPS